MTSFHRDGLCVRRCGLLMDLEGKANFGLVFEVGSLWLPFSLKGKYR